MNKYKAKIMIIKAIKKYAQDGDSEAFSKVMERVMSKVDSTSLNDVVQYSKNRLKIDEATVIRAYKIFVKRLYQQEVSKKKEQVVGEFLKMFDISKEELEPELKPTSKLKMKKEADLKSIWDKIKQMSPIELTKNAYNFISSFDNFKDAAEHIIKFVDELSKIQTESKDVTTAAMSDKIGKIAGLMMIISLIMTLGAAGTSDLADKIPSAVHSGDEVKSIATAISSWGLTGILAYLSNLFGKKESKEKKERRIYQGPSL